MSNERFEANSIPSYLVQSAIQKYMFASKHLKGENILDVGCGIGYGSKIMHNQHPDLNFYGCDKDLSAIKYAQKKFKSIKFEKCDACSTNYEDNFFDTVVSFETLEHIHNGKVFFNEITRILKTNGVLILSTPNRIYDEKVGQNINPFHETLYSKDQLYDLLSNYFSNVEIFGQKETLSEIMYKLPFTYMIFRKIKPLLLPFFKSKASIDEISLIQKTNPSFEPTSFWESCAYLISIATNGSVQKNF